jgi:hypothetical protein
MFLSYGAAGSGAPGQEVHRISPKLAVTHNKAHFTGAANFGIVVKTPTEFLKMLRENQ